MRGSQLTKSRAGVQSAGGRCGRSPPTALMSVPSVRHPLPARPVRRWGRKAAFSPAGVVASSCLTMEGIEWGGGGAAPPSPPLGSQRAPARPRQPVTGSAGGAESPSPDPGWGASREPQHPASGSVPNRGAPLQPRGGSRGPGLSQRSGPPGGLLVCFRPIGLGLLASGGRWWAQVAILGLPCPSPSRSHR